MFFAGVGGLSGYTKMQALERQWEQRKKDLEEKGEREDPAMAIYRKQLAEQREQQEITSLTSKVRMGIKLSRAEMEHLRAKAPAEYKKAVAAEKERERHRRELLQAKTKEEAERKRANRIQKLLTEAASVAGSKHIPAEQKEKAIEQIRMRMKAVNDEHQSFKRTTKYSALPTEAEVKKAAEKLLDKAAYRSREAKKRQEEENQVKARAAKAARDDAYNARTARKARASKLSAQA